MLGNPAEGDRSVVMGVIHSCNCVGECLHDECKEVEISGGEGGGCVNDSPDAWAV
jgi:hypothetical protein